MNSPNKKTQQQRTKIKNVSAFIAIGLAMTTLFQASTVKSEKTQLEMTINETKLIEEVDEWFTDEELSLEDQVIMDSIKEEVNFKIFDAQGVLLAEGKPQEDQVVRQLVNQAEFMSEFGGEQYYSIAK
jgi:hypothetical protein